MRYLFITLLFTGFSLTGLTQQTLRIQSNTEGLQLSANGSVASWSSKYFVNLPQLEPLGVGGGAQVGYGFTQKLTGFARYEYHSFKLKNDWDTYRFSGFGFGIRWNFSGTVQRLRPYAELGLTRVGLKISPVLLNNQLRTYDLLGTLFTPGAGVQYFLQPNLALGANVNVSVGNFGNFQIDGSGISDKPDVTITHIGLSLVYVLPL